MATAIAGQRKLSEFEQALLAQVQSLSAEVQALREAKASRPGRTPQTPEQKAESLGSRPMVSVAALDKIPAQVWNDFKTFGVEQDSNGNPVKVQKRLKNGNIVSVGKQDEAFAWWTGDCRSFAYTAANLLAANPGSKLSELVMARPEKNPGSNANTLLGLRHRAQKLVDNGVKIK